MPSRRDIVLRIAHVIAGFVRIQRFYVLLGRIAAVFFISGDFPHRESGNDLRPTQKYGHIGCEQPDLSFPLFFCAFRSVRILCPNAARL